VIKKPDIWTKDEIGLILIGMGISALMALALWLTLGR
jgi:hypothetical protein